MSLNVAEDGTITVRAPYRMAARAADAFVEGHSEWILSRIQAYEKLKEERPVYTDEEREAGRERAGKKLEEQKTRWGSCSAKGNLNFNWKLILMPEEILDYLVVHELAHRIEMNHSPAFWRVVEREIPDYEERRMWLKKNGAKY